MECDEQTLGVYLHIPFCDRICPYCDFAVVAARPLRAEDEDRYVAALLAELEHERGRWEGLALATLYLGGGTPSLLRPASVARLIDSVRAAFPSRDALEVTLEVNPSTSPREHLAAFRAAGVNRLSIGVQSFDDQKLRRLGRAHRALENHRTLDAAREAGFDNLSVDLIFRTPGESLAQFQADLDAFVAVEAPHLSTYELTVEEGTPFGAAQRAGRLPSRLEEDDAAAMIEQIEARFVAAGLRRYELSSYARPGFESRHNQRYWERQPVLGLGLGAWSSESSRRDAPHGARRANLSSLEAYLGRVEAGEAPTDLREVASVETARSEAMFLGLRRALGVDAARFEREFGAAPGHFYPTEIETLVDSGLVEQTEAGDLVLTPRGRLLADSVAAQFVGESPEERPSR